MSTESEVECSRSDDHAVLQETEKKETKFVYTREFLLSLAEIDLCKKLPSGFDTSILSKIDSRIHLHSDSASGRWNGTKIQHSWKNPADGVLGKGALLGTPGWFEGAPAPKVQSYNLLDRSVAPYRPPHFCKKNFQSGRERKDLKEGDSFDSSDHPYFAKAEEERRRRDSVVAARKERRIAIQENQNNIADEQKENLNPDNATVLDDFGSRKTLFNKYHQSEECAASSTSKHASSYPSAQSSISSELILPAAARLFNKCSQSEECALLPTPKNARLASAQNSIFSKLLPHALTSKSLEQSIETKSKEKADENDSTSLSSRGINVPHKLMASISPSAIEKKQRNSASRYVVLALSKKDTGITNSEAAPLKTNICSTENAISLERKSTSGSETRFGKSHTKKLPWNELLVSQNSSAARVAQGDRLVHSGFRLTHDYYNIIPSSVDESIGTNHDSAVPSRCVKQTGKNKVEVYQVVSDNHMKTKSESDLPGEELEHNLVSGLDEKEKEIDEICLPDEDNLITSDDFKFPNHPVLLPDRNLSETDLLASSSRRRGNIDQVLSALNLPLDERSLSSTEVPANCFESDDRKDSNPSYGNPQAGKLDLKFQHSQTNPGRAVLPPSEFQGARRSKIKPLALRNHSYNCSPIGNYSVYLLPSFFQDAYAASTSFRIPVMLPLSQQSLLPAEFPYQVNELSMPSLRQNFPLNNNPQIYSGFTMPNRDPIVGGNSNQAGIINHQLPVMEQIDNQMHAGWPRSGNVQQFG